MRGLNNLGKVPIVGVTQERLEMCPIKSGAGVLFAPRRNVFVASNGTQRVVSAQLGAQLSELRILNGFKHLTFEAFELNANGKIVAVAAAAPLGGAGMPSTRPCGGELLDMTAATDDEVARHL